MQAGLTVKVRCLDVKHGMTASIRVQAGNGWWRRNGTALTTSFQTGNVDRAIMSMPYRVGNYKRVPGKICSQPDIETYCCLWCLYQVHNHQSYTTLHIDVT